MQETRGCNWSVRFALRDLGYAGTCLAYTAAIRSQHLAVAGPWTPRWPRCVRART